MESVGKTMSQMNRSQQFNYEELVAQILAEPEIATFIQKEGLSDVEIRRSISKFNQYISERNRFALGDADYIARGYKPVLVMNEASFGKLFKGLVCQVQTIDDKVKLGNNSLF